MSNFSTATEATSTALDSAGSAAKENSKYVEGLEAATQEVKKSFEELSNTVIDSGLVKGILDLANGFLQLLNTPIGSFITQITLLTGVLWGGTGLIQAMKVIPNLLSGVITAASGATSILSLSVPQLALIAAGIAAIIAIAPSFYNWYKEITNDVDYANEKLEENNSKLNENKTRLEELEKIPVSNRTSSIEAEIEALKNENAELEKNIDYWDSKSAQGALEDVSGYKVDTQLADEYLGTAITLETIPFVKNTQEAIDILKSLNLINKDVQDSLEGTGYALEQVGDSFKIVFEEPKLFMNTWENYYQTLLTRQKEIEQVFKSGGEITADMVIEYKKITEELDNYANIVERADEVSHSANETQLELARGIRETEVTYQELADSIYTVEDSFQILSEGQALNEIQVEQLLEKYPELESAIKQVGDAYSIEQEALYDLASAGNEAARQLVESQIKATEITIQEISERIERYKKEISSLKEAFNVQNILNASGKGMQSLLGYINTYSNDLADLILKLGSAEESLSSYQTSLEELKSQQSSWDKPLRSFIPDEDESGKKSEAIEEQSKAFKEQNEIIEHNIYLREKQGASQEEIIQLYKNYQDELHKQADWYRAQGLDENSEYIRDIQKQWWEVQDTIDGIYKDIADSAEESAEKAKEAWEEQKEAVINWVQSEIDDLENLFSTVANQAQKEIDLLEEEKQKVEDYYQSQIDALEEANEELEKQIELEEALDDLARARQTKVMVYKDGRFQYVEDIDEVSEAQSNLEKMERENALNDKINALEEEKQAELDKLNASIEYWENYLEGFGDFVDDYEEEQNRKYLSDKYNIQLEGENWEASLSQLSNYVERYKQLQSQLNTVQNSQYGSGSSSGSGNTNSQDWSQIWWDAENDPTLSESERQEIQDWAHSQKEQEMAGSGAVFDKNSGQWHYASGTFSASGGLSLVGENGPELRVLGQGDGIIPSDITKNLWAWGVTTPASMMNNIVGGLQSMGQQISITIQNFNPNLPNIQDGQGFANYMRTNFWREAIQFAKA